MHSRLFTGVTLGTVLLTGVVLHHAGWLSKRPVRPAANQVEVRTRATVQDLFASDAGCRFRNGQPTHWRSLLLKR